MFRVLMAAAIAVALAGEARAQLTCSPAPAIDCTGGCTETPYGLGDPADWALDVDPWLDERVEAGDPDAAPRTRDDFAGSYLLNSGVGDPSDPRCDGEDGHLPVIGTFIFREMDTCDPFDAGTYPLVCENTLTSCTTSADCGGAPCGPAQGCPVELAEDLNGDNPGDPPAHFFSEPRVLVDNFICGFEPPGTFFFCDQFISVASSGRMVGVGFRVPNTDPGAPAGSTRVKWDLDAGGCHGSPSGGETRICCNSDSSQAVDVCAFLADIGVPKYPIVPSLAGFGGNYRNFPDWIFDGDPAFPPFGKFEHDLNFQVPGQRYGVCQVNRDVGCDCKAGGTDCGDTVDPDGPGPATAPDPCPTLDADPDTAGLQPDSCDLRDRGMRLSPSTRLADGSPNPDECAATIYVLRGTPSQNCMLSIFYDVDGDPGPDCSVLNYGPHRRPDQDCNGIDDTTEGPNPPGDLCPFYTELDSLSDTNGDGIGDACQCADANGDGEVNVEDILIMNGFIFNPPGDGTWLAGNRYMRVKAPLADATNNEWDPTLNGLGEVLGYATGGDVNVADILAANGRIFDVGQPSCGRYPICGDGSIDVGRSEECDDANTAPGDGCSSTCEVEFGFNCVYDPGAQRSVCSN